MQYIHSKYLRAGLDGLYKRGGSYQRAAKTIIEILWRINNGKEPFIGVATTKHGESRIKHCRKYDLTGACRLVTVVNDDVCFMLFAGTHDETDEWLNRHQGKTFAVGENDQIEEITKTENLAGEEKAPVIYDRSIPGESALLDRIAVDVIAPLLDGLAYIALKPISELTVFSTDDEICSACLLVDDSDRQDSLYACLAALARNKQDEATCVVKLFTGELKEVSENVEWKEGQDFQKVPTDSPEWAHLYEHFVKTAGYKDWMLFLHPDQRHMVELDFSGSAKLLGVSGSGKTCVVVKRALRLAETYPGQPVLILTLNRPLAKLIGDLVESAAPAQIKDLISVNAFFEVCQKLLYAFESGSERIYSDVAWKSGDHIDAIWREFYRCDLNNNDASVMLPVHDILIAQGIDAEQYIREEFDWIRSALAHQQREAYLDMERTGRSFALLKQHRQLLLAGLTVWEKKMHAIGVIDGLGLVSALQPWLEQITPVYRCILVDESQDFGTSELDIIRRLVEPSENDLFLCGDAAQQVSSKYQKLAEANIKIPGARSNRILKNYRNSKEILTAAHSVLTRHINEWLMDSEEFEVLDPEFADFSGSVPLLMAAEDLQHEIANAMHFIQAEVGENPRWKGCVAIAGYSLYEIQVFGRRLGIRVLDGTSSIDEDALYISDLAQTKGFEFDVMVVVNARAGVLPNPAVPEMEQAKNLAQLYVAMTRAKSQLVLSYHGEISPLLQDMDDVFLQDNWSDYLQSELKLLGVPPLLDELNEDTQIPKNLAEMDGPQFLYTEYAIGQPQLLIEAIRTKIGRSRVGGGEGKGTVGVDMGFVHQMTIDNPSARNRFGREATKQLQEIGMRLVLSKLHRVRLVDEAG